MESQKAGRGDDGDGHVDGDGCDGGDGGDDGDEADGGDAGDGVDEKVVMLQSWAIAIGKVALVSTEGKAGEQQQQRRRRWW